MSELLKSLVERRNKTWNEAKALLDTVEKAGGEFTAEEDTQWARMNEDLETLDARIAEIRNAEERSKKIDEIADLRNAPTPLSNQRAKDNQILRDMISGGGKRSYEFGSERRDLTVGTASAGGNTVPTGFYDTLVEHMIENSAIRQTNVTVLTTASGVDLEVPKTTSHPTAVIVAEGGAIGESDPVFGQVTLQAYKYGFMTQISKELEQDTGVDLVGYLAREGAQALANGSGAHFITGTGSGQPNGVVTASTLGVTGGTGVSGAFTADNLIDLFYSVIAPYRRAGTWLMSSAGIRDARKLKGSDNNYLWQPGLQADDPDLLLGRPVVDDTNIADPALSAKSVIFGDLSRYFIRDVAGVRVERSEDYAFNTDLVSWRFLFRTDGDLIDTTGAVKHFVGAGT
ncbi:MAG: phage major capsid protein [Acidimicrobiia bacterium]